jgi:hypothetical protein
VEGFGAKKWRQRKGEVVFVDGRRKVASVTASTRVEDSGGGKPNQQGWDAFLFHSEAAPSGLIPSLPGPGPGRAGPSAACPLAALSPFSLSPGDGI